MLDDFEELKFLEEIEDYLNRIEKEKSINIEEELEKIKKDIEKLNRITKKVLDILGRLMKLIENNKINKIRDSNEKILKKKLPKGLITPRNAYRIPILETLYELGGKGEVKKVLKILESKMKNMFNNFDYEFINDRERRWQNNARWCRLMLVHDGLLKRDSPQGIWELSQEGYRYIEDYLKSKKDG